LRQVEHQLRLAEPEEVSMPLDEPGHGEPPAQVDDLRPRAGELPDLRIAAHRQNPIATDRDRLRARLFRVDGDDLAVKEDEVGGIRLPRRRRGSDGEDNEEERRSHRAPTVLRQTPARQQAISSRAAGYPREIRPLSPSALPRIVRPR